MAEIWGSKSKVQESKTESCSRVSVLNIESLEVELYEVSQLKYESGKFQSCKVSNSGRVLILHDIEDTRDGEEGKYRCGYNLTSSRRGKC